NFAVSHTGEGVPQTKAPLISEPKKQIAEKNHGSYIIHNNCYFVSTNQVVDGSRIGEEIGRVKRIGDWSLKREGDSNAYPPNMVIMYQLPGADPNQSIVVLTKMNSADPGTYEIFRNDGKVETDTSQILSAKNDPEEVGYALKNMEKLNPYQYEITGMGERAVPTLAIFSPKDVAKSNQGQVQIEYQVQEAKGTVDGVSFSGRLTVYEYGVDTKGDNPSTLFGEAFKINPLTTVLSEFDQNGIHWQEYAKNIYLGIKGDTYYELHLDGVLSTDRFREFIDHFQPAAR
ncbi:MAG: hypothetical protein ACXVC1_07150, partial [Tumebacillaceae bacterium]